jgi:transcriptional regulator with XRE-family HTH domain
MQDEKAAFAKRLKDAMAAKGWPPRAAVLERQFNLAHWGTKGMSLQGVNRWLKGEVIPRGDNLATLATVLGVHPQTLRYGVPAQPPGVADPGARWEDDIGWTDRELFTAFMRLPVPQRKVVREVIQAFTKAYVPPPQVHKTPGSSG